MTYLGEGVYVCDFGLGVELSAVEPEDGIKRTVFLSNDMVVRFLTFLERAYEMKITVTRVGPQAKRRA